MPTDRPRLVPGVPILTLDPTTLQIGCEAEHGLRLVHPQEGLRIVLTHLDGSHTPSELAGRAGIDPSQVTDLLDALARRGLLEQPPAAGAPLAGLETIRLIGSGPDAARIAVALLDAEAGHVALVDRTGGHAVAGVVRHLRGRDEVVRGRLSVVTQRGWHALPPATPTVLATGHLEVDRVLLADLMRDDDPHLVLRPLPHGLVVGPFVVPGVTSCLECADRFRTAQDPTWPRQLGPLSGQAVAYPAGSLDWAAALAVQQFAAWWRGADPDLVDHTVTLSTDRWQQAWRAWPRHPACPCRWRPQEASTPSSPTASGSAMIRSTASP